MQRISRRDFCRRIIPAMGILAPSLLFTSGCTHEAEAPPVASNAPRLRVLIAQNIDRADVLANDPRIALDSQPVALNFPHGFTTPISLQPGGWQIGRYTVHSGELNLQPATVEGIRINGVSYRGAFRFIPANPGRFDLINDVTVEDYLKGVVTREMYASWPIEAIKAQAIASRTYALYESLTSGRGREWDVFSDERSQVYGGISGESAASRQAVASTSGLVLSYGPGVGNIFRSYFSSCCGGVTQAASDAFPGDPYIPPLSEQSHGSLCNASKYFNWGPITIKKAELARRIHLWAIRKSKELGRSITELNLTSIYKIQTQSVNRYGRPTRVLVVDTKGTQFSWSAEDLRGAVDTDAQTGTTLPSSFCRINGEPNSDTVTFFEGHGYGHGVGMCQWCARAEAAAGQGFQQILAEAYPQSKLVRAY